VFRFKKIKVDVCSSQNSTPDVARQVEGQKGRDPGVHGDHGDRNAFPAGASFLDWQFTQLQALQTALAQARGT